jgi:hypothetical protein
MKREKQNSRDLNEIELEDMAEIKSLMDIVNDGTSFTKKAKDEFVLTVASSSVVDSMNKKYILTDDERITLRDALRKLISTLGEA